ncbi:MAG: MATE family efflux transporter, partial [Clostridia bacterium]|nr:MATE family efflux transporter [Clostridia bacterium]
ENKMGVMPINKLLITMSLPVIFSMLIQALYNVVDSIFVARISENALTAVSLAFPFQNLMIAVASGTCVGVNAILSRSLGQKDYDAVNKSANVGIFLNFASYVVFMLLGLFGSELFFTLQTDIPEIVQGGTVYLKICTAFSFGMFGQFVFERLLLSTGKTVYNMISQLVGAVINIILDPILIFGMFGLPEMGIAGAAAATVIGQIIAMFVAMMLNHHYNHYVKIKLSEIRPQKEYVKAIYAVGVPSILMMSIGSVMTFCLNKILIAFTATATAVFGVYFKLQSFVFMPVFGLNNGMVPIVAYNYGARSKDRVMQTVKLAVMYAVAVMLIGFALFQIIPGVMLSLFNASADMLSIGIPALRTISYSFLFAGFCIVCGSVFQALGNGVYSLVVSVLRQLVVLLPVAYLLSLTGNLNAVWLSFPIAELMSVAASAFFLRRVIREKF